MLGAKGERDDFRGKVTDSGRVRYRVALGPAIIGQYQDHVSFPGNDTVLVGEQTGQSLI